MTTEVMVSAIVEIEPNLIGRNFMPRLTEFLSDYRDRLASVLCSEMRLMEHRANFCQVGQRTWQLGVWIEGETVDEVALRGAARYTLDEIALDWRERTGVYPVGASIADIRRPAVAV